MLYRVENGISAEAALPGLRTEAPFLQVLQSKVVKGEMWPAGNSLVQKSSEEIPDFVLRKKWFFFFFKSRQWGYCLFLDGPSLKSRSLSKMSRPWAGEMT